MKLMKKTWKLLTAVLLAAVMTLSMITCAAAVAVLIWQHYRPHDPAELYVNQVKLEEKSE